MDRRKFAPQPYLITRSLLDTFRHRGIPYNAKVDKPRAVEERFNNYVKEKSHQMTQNWSNSVENLSRQQTEELHKRSQQRCMDDQRAYEAVHEQQRLEQRSKIEAIETALRRAQPGPRQLDSAALHAECLSVQQAQRQEMALRNISNRQQVEQEGRQLRLQNYQWTREQQHRQQEHHLRAMRYKQDLRAMCEERKMQRDMEMFHLQYQNHQVDDLASHRAIDKERREMERRRIQLRQTATDAMRMAEQRRLREKVSNQLQEKLNLVYLEGKEKQQEALDEQKKVLVEEQKKRQEVGQAKVAELLQERDEEQRQTEELVLKNAGDDLKRQLEARDKAEVERKKKLKAERIKFHLAEMEAEKAKKEKEKDQAKVATELRLKNEQVTKEFQRQEKARKLKEFKELRTTLGSQQEEKREVARAEKEETQVFTCRHCDFSSDHNEFVKCAKEALRVAKDRKWPVQPYVGAINAYGREHFVEEKPLLPHLEVRHPAVSYERAELPKNNSKEIIRYNLEQLRALNPVSVI